MPVQEYVLSGIIHRFNGMAHEFGSNHVFLRRRIGALQCVCRVIQHIC